MVAPTCRTLRLFFAAVAGTASAREFIPPITSSLQSLGDARVATVACCGAEGAPLASSVLGRGVVQGAGTALALINEPRVADAALGVAASDVVVLELRQADLVNDSPHGILLLKPLLQRALQMFDIKSQKKLLMVVVTDADLQEASEEDLRKLAKVGLERMWRNLLKPRGIGIDTLDQLIDLELYAFPEAADAQDALSGRAALKERFYSVDSPRYIFTDGANSCSASTARLCLARLYKYAGDSPQVAVRPAVVTTAHDCAVVADAAIKAFQKGLAVLKKDADPTYLPDFGERSGELIDEALARFDDETSALRAVPAVRHSRMALEAQLLRALYTPYRKQLTHMQRQALTKFSQRLAGLRPSANVEDDLRALIKDTSASLEQEAKRLLPPDAPWSYEYEKNAVLAAINEQAANHVETLRVRGLYLPKTGQNVPIDFSAHWLLLSPFGADARYETISPKEKPKYRPKASPMRMSASDGFKARLRDPKDMVFTEKA